MDTYANILLITIPIFLVLIMAEISYGAWKNDLKHSYMDTISSLSSGFTNLMVDILGLGIIIFSYPFFYERLKVIELEESIFLYFIAFNLHSKLFVWIKRRQIIKGYFMLELICYLKIYFTYLK